MAAPTGEQFVLERDGALGPVTATVVELAAGLRRLSVGGTEIVQDYRRDSLPSWGSGIVLVPWPNRVEDGRWEHEGATQQLDITEPKLGNAIHGLLRNTGYRVTDREPGAITLSAPVFPQHGYPFHLDTSVRYALTDDGIEVTHGIHNAGSAAAPVAIGVHPFFRIGDVPQSELTITLAADSYIGVDDRLLPTGDVPVDGTTYDLRGGARLGDLELDTAFADLALDGDRYVHRLAAPDGRAVEVWSDDQFPFVQVFTTSEYVTEDGLIDAVAIEPMTAPANALVSGRGLRWLEPGDQLIATWGARFVPTA